MIRNPKIFLVFMYISLSFITAILIGLWSFLIGEDVVNNVIGAFSGMSIVLILITLLMR